MLSGRGLCDELITRPEESYQLWCVIVCDLETSRIGAPYIYDISNLRVNQESVNCWDANLVMLLCRYDSMCCRGFIRSVAKIQILQPK